MRQAVSCSIFYGRPTFRSSSSQHITLTPSFPSPLYSSRVGTHPLSLMLACHRCPCQMFHSRLGRDGEGPGQHGCSSLM
jgi:hypothetical protein